MRKIVFTLLLISGFAYAQSEPFILDNGLRGFYDLTNGTFQTCTGINGYLSGEDACMNLSSAQWTLLLEQQVNYETALACSVVEPEPEITEETFNQIALNEDERENGWVYIIWMDTSGFHTRIKSPSGEWWENLNDEDTCFPSEILLNLDNYFVDLDSLVEKQELFAECMQLIVQ